MKYKVIVFLLLIELCSLPFIPAVADVDSITFRNIDWYSHPSVVSSAMESISGVTTPWFGAVNKSAKIESWFKKWQYFYTDDAISNGGAILKFSRVPIAGYTADVELSFMWMTEDSQVINRFESAEFYMGVYTIEGYKDLFGVYNEIKEKLKTTYGNYVSQSYFDGGIEGVKWTANDGSLIWLRIRKNTVYKNYEDITITYFAPNGEERLKHLSSLMIQQIVDKEDERREQNKDNYEGL